VERSTEDLGLGDIIDLVLSEYSYTLNTLLTEMTPAQLFILAKAINRRQKMNIKRMMTAIRVAFNANKSEWQQAINDLDSSAEIIKQAKKLSQINIPGFKMEKK